MERSFEFGRALQTSGLVGLLIVAACLAAIAVGIGLVVLPARRRSFELLVGGYVLLCLVPLALGWLGKKQAEAMTEQLLATLKQPTQEDRERGYGEARDVLVLGALLSIPGAVLLPLVWLRRRKDFDAPHSPFGE